MRGLCTSIGLRHSCAEGVESSCYIHWVLPTNWSLELIWSNKCVLTATQSMNLPLIVQKGLQAFRCCLKEHLLYLIMMFCCGMVPLRSFWMVLKMVRNIPGQLRSETKINGRAEHSNRGAGKIERSIASHGSAHCKCCKWWDLESKSPQSLSPRKWIFVT